MTLLGEQPRPIALMLSAGAAALAGFGSIVSLLIPEQVFGHETPTLFDAAVAQDLVNVFLVVPSIVILVVRASRGHVLSALCLTGCLGFTAYNYAIYAFSIHFGLLFLPWVAVLGLSTFAMAGMLASPRTLGVGAVSSSVTIRLASWFLIVVATVFALLWLSEIVPELVGGLPSSSASAWKIPTNPVHVLDLALFLPAVCASGVLLLKQNPVGYTTAPASLVFLALTSLPILVTPFVAQAHGNVAVWVVMVPIGVIAAASLAVLWRLLRTMQSRASVQTACGQPASVMS